MADTDKPVNNNARYGLILFALYCLLYGGFMGLNVYDPKLMASTPFAGVNTAILYGFGLILAALFLAGIYMYLCHGQVEDEAPAAQEGSQE